MFFKRISLFMFQKVFLILQSYIWLTRLCTKNWDLFIWKNWALMSTLCGLQIQSKITGLTIRSETLYFLNRETATGKFMLMVPTKVIKSDKSSVYSIKFIHCVSFKVFIDYIESFFWPQINSKLKFVCIVHHIVSLSSTIFFVVAASYRAG